jgi:hypothetical protein
MPKYIATTTAQEEWTFDGVVGSGEGSRVKERYLDRQANSFTAYGLNCSLCPISCSKLK